MGAAFPEIQVSPVSKQAVDAYLTAQNNPDLSDEEKIKTAIDAYFTSRYESQKLRKALNLDVLIEDKTMNWVKKENDKRDIENYIAEQFGVSTVSYTYTLEYRSITIHDDTATINLLENNEILTSPHFVTSALGDLEHVFTLHKKKGAWVIYEDEYQDETLRALKNRTKREILATVDKNKRLFQPQQPKVSLANPLTRPKGLLDIIQINTPNKPLALTTHSYNRSLAVNYADTYWNTANPPYYIGDPDYDCANFVSQSMYAGEGYTPPATDGMQPWPYDYDTDWYYVFDDSGSRPWIDVNYQYNFITGNTSQYGPYGSSGEEICGASIGDVVQIKQSSSFDHEAIIAYIAYPCGGLSAYYVDAHTTNYYRYSLANWALFDMRFIFISGWRGN